jgi:hypothetical protein
MPYGNLALDTITTSTGQTFGASSASTMKNRIINGDMRIDQRNAGANSTATGYTLDRWAYQASQATKGTWGQNFGSITPPSGFTNYLGFQTGGSTVSLGSSDYFEFTHPIEGYNISDLSWGTANAKTVTVSFWVLSSLTGTFGASLHNNGNGRTYPFTYGINQGNTWEYKTITIPGDTSGTWLTNNGAGIVVIFSLGMGSSLSGSAGSWQSAGYNSVTGAVNVLGTVSATWFMTGVQLEVGAAATTFDYRSFGTELALCQRYFEKTWSLNTAVGTATESNVDWYGTHAQSLASTGIFQAQPRPFKVVKRAAPTMAFWDTAGNSGKWTRYLVGGGPNQNNAITVDTQDDSGFRFFVAAGSSTSNVCGHWTASAEL